MGATAAAVVTGAITAPLAIKAAGVQAALGGDARLKALFTDWSEAERVWGGLYDSTSDLVRPFPPGLKRKEDEAHGLMRAAFLRFMDAPAHTPGGVLLKLTSFMDEQEWQDLAAVDTMDEVMLVAVRRDLERLAGGARS